MSNSDKLATPVESFRDWVKDQFHQQLDPIFLFHNYNYAQEIEGAVTDLVEKSSDFNEEVLPALQIAALAYPLGAIRLDPDNLREKFRSKKATKRSMILNMEAEFLPFSQVMLQDFLAEQQEEYFRRSGLSQTFRSDPEPAHSKTEPEPSSEAPSTDTTEIAVPGPVELLKELGGEGILSPAAQLLKDAIHSWYGRKRFGRRSEQLALENRALLGDHFDANRFQTELEEKVLRHSYSSEAAMGNYEGKRRSNLRDQRDAVLKTEKVELRRKSGKDLGRGIDTLYRTAFKNHISLSQIADGKANMMISINTIILSILLAVSGAGIGFFQELFFERPLMLLPIITLLLSSLAAVVFAVFSARPKVTEYRIKKKKNLINSKEASLLYFGNFLKLEKEDFVEYMEAMKYRQEELYGDMSKDLYDLGAVLHRKYLLLTISYNIFVGGLALSVMLFLLVYILKFF